MYCWKYDVRGSKIYRIRNIRDPLLRCCLLHFQPASRLGQSQRVVSIKMEPV